MTSFELISLIGRSDLGLSAGLLAVLALRLPARRWLGARAAYGLWLLPLVAMAAVLLPARTVIVPMPAPELMAITAPNPAMIPKADQPVVVARPAPKTPLPAATVLAGLWGLGVIGCLAWFARNQGRFLRLAKVGRAGPAAVGVIRPRIVTPADFDSQFSRAERAAIIAHEAAHIAGQHPRLNALAALVQAIHWFNPLVHVAAQSMRVDQELACDAKVVETRPRLRRPYAEALLKTQLSSTPLPLGCYWPPKSEHPLTRRVEMLNRPASGRRLRIAGACGVVLLTAGAGLAAWAAQPPREIEGPAAPKSATVKSPAIRPAQPDLRIDAEGFKKSADGKSGGFTGSVKVEMGRIDPVTGQTVFDHNPLSVAPKAYTLIPDPDVAVHVAGNIERVEWLNPRAIVHLKDEKTGRLWAVETGTTNTLRRGGFDEAHSHGRVEFRGLGAKDDRCAPECKALMREMTFPDGRKVFLGSATASGRAATPSEKQAALAAGDWRKAAILGATAPDIVRALQAQGADKDINPDQAVVVLPSDGGAPQVTAMKPLPPLPGEVGQTKPLAGSGFRFSNPTIDPGAKPGAIILYPPGGADTFGSSGEPGKAAFMPVSQPGPANADARAAVIRAAQAEVDLTRVAYDDADQRFRAGLITALELQGFKRDVALAQAKLAVAQAGTSAQSKSARIAGAQADAELAHAAYDEAARRFQAGLITTLDLQGFRRAIAAAEARLAMAKAT